MALKVEKRRIKKEIEKLLRNYVGTRLRENSFDPKGKMESTYLNDLAHYDLAINVALLWLNEDEDQEVLENEKVVISSPAGSKYPNKMEREAMILSSFAGILMNSIPLEDILELYRYRPTVTQFCKTIKGHVQPSSLSLHPFAMLTAACAAEHARKQSIKLKVGKITSKQNFMGPSMTSRSADQPPDNCSGTQQNADTSSHPGEEKAEEETGI
ncbi:uncharacterized protein C2orf80-like isoform X1 [Heptranchias perlo]|uniref:uncharacterized protein C2orf80-like isoform X1 n=1 Tax=Heptranchias perlo TaxID=212740 RepID=UPI003559F186